MAMTNVQYVKMCLGDTINLVGYKACNGNSCSYHVKVLSIIPIDENTIIFSSDDGNVHMLKYDELYTLDVTSNEFGLNIYSI